MYRKLLALWAFSGALAMLASCAPKKPVVATGYEGLTAGEIIEMHVPVKSVRASVYLVLEKPGGTLSGDAALVLSESELSLRVYSMGFLSGELYEKGGIITSEPKVDDSRASDVVDGLRNSLLWWNILGYRVIETPKEYIVKNSWRRITLDRGTMLPVKQTIELASGRTMEVVYGAPMKSGEVWYPSVITMKHGKYSVKVSVREITFERAAPAAPNAPAGAAISPEAPAAPAGAAAAPVADETTGPSDASEPLE